MCGTKNHAITSCGLYHVQEKSNISHVELEYMKTKLDMNPEALMFQIWYTSWETATIYLSFSLTSTVRKTIEYTPVAHVFAWYRPSLSKRARSFILKE